MPVRWTAEKQRAVYVALVAARKCVNCRAGLQETDSIRCIECAEARRERAARRNATKRGRTLNAAAARRLRARRIAEGLCAACPRPPVPGARLCQRHLEEHRVSEARYLDRKEAAYAQ